MISLILNLLTVRTIRISKEFQICQRHTEVERSGVKKNTQSKEQHESKDIDPIDDGKF